MGNSPELEPFERVNLLSEPPDASKRGRRPGLTLFADPASRLAPLIAVTRPAGGVSGARAH